MSELNDKAVTRRQVVAGADGATAWLGRGGGGRGGDGAGGGGVSAGRGGEGGGDLAAGAGWLQGRHGWASTVRCRKVPQAS